MANKTDSIELKLNQLNIDNNLSENSEDGEKWQFKLKDLYRLALHFYKGNCPIILNPLLILLIKHFEIDIVFLRTAFSFKFRSFI
jgi:hypothetical protein